MRGFCAGILVSSSVMEAAAVILIVVVVFLILIACNFKFWRRSVALSLPASVKDEDIERPLIPEDPALSQNLNYDVAPNDTAELSSLEFDGHIGIPQSILDESRKILQPLYSQHSCTSNFVLRYPNTSEDFPMGLTLKRGTAVKHFAEEQLKKIEEDTNGSKKGMISHVVSYEKPNLRSNLLLEVISGPSRGFQYSYQSKNSSQIQVQIGRISPADVILKDSEVSGKHAMINWNVNKLKWELIDMGSLNGTILNSRAVQLPQSKSRCWSDPVELSNGDTITLGTSSKILVHVTFETISNTPFGIGKASDPMAVRRGGKKLPMEDVCLDGWPLPGLDQFGLFAIYDGHGGANAATSASKIMPEAIAGILSNSYRRERVLSLCDASDVLKEAFYETEAKINHSYEGCTATVLLIWVDDEKNFFFQCANVGDSACIMSTGGMPIKMTEDHRITSNSERLRIQALGPPLRDGETRICGMNLARMLGDKFLKEQDARFSSEPYISEVARMKASGDGFALLASDGFWDVVNIKRAVQLIHQALERNRIEGESCADKVANSLLTEARNLRTKDNTSIIFLDFTLQGV